MMILQRSTLSTMPMLLVMKRTGIRQIRTAKKRAPRPVSKNDTASKRSFSAPKETPKDTAIPILEPTSRQLRIVAFRSAIPMIGFGFMDNLVMIQAGEAIDMSIGVAFGLSTMTAAGFGQCFSDVAGFTCGGMVDAGVTKMRLPHHNLTLAQLDLKSARMWHTLGGCVGVVTGCLLGMSCLLFMDTDRADRAKKAKELQSIFESVLEEGHVLVGAERATLWMLEEDSTTKQKTIWSRVASGVDGLIQAPLEGSIVGECIRTGEIVNIENAYEDDRFDQHVDAKTGFHTHSVLAVPVRNEKGKVIGAIQMINKQNNDDNNEECGKGKAGFGPGDIKCVQMLCSHVASFMRVVHRG